MVGIPRGGEADGGTLLRGAMRHSPSASSEERRSLRVYDPGIPVNIYELGLIYGVAVVPSGVIAVRMTLTGAGCPAAQALPCEVEDRVRAVLQLGLL